MGNHSLFNHSPFNQDWFQLFIILTEVTWKYLEVKCHDVYNLRENMLEKKEVNKANV